MRTQWHTGMNGPIGLRYEVLQAVIKMEKVPAAQWKDVLEGVQVMEHETLRIWREKR